MAMRAPLALASWAFVAAATTAKADERPVVVVDATTDGSGAAVVVRLNAALGPEPTLGPIAPGLVDALANPTPVDGAAIASASTALTNARDRLGRYYNYPDEAQLRGFYAAAGPWSEIGTESGEGRGYEGAAARFVSITLRKPD